MRRLSNNLNMKDSLRLTTQAIKKYVNTVAETKQDKLTYVDDVEEFKRFTAEEAEVVISVDVGRICSVASLNLKVGKNYNVKTLVNTDIPKNISENLTKNVRTNGKMLIEFTATAVKDEEASQQLGQDIIKLEYNSDDCAYDIMIFDKIVFQVNEETQELDTIYSPDHATISIPFVSDYLEIGLKKLLKEEVSNDFLKTYKFVTQEDKDNWNNKQDKIKNGVFIKQTPPPDTYGYNKFNLVLNILENGLYIATNEISFYDETTLLENGAELSNGKKECSFHIYEGHLFRYTKIEYSTEYCYIENLTTGITCCLDVEGGITGIYANNGFMYLDDIEEILQQKADKSELFSGDYNDLENRPCYDTRELIELTYDGDVTGKVIATEPLESMVKVSDEVVDYETYIKSVVGIYHPDNGIQYHNISDKIEGEDYFLVKGEKMIWGGNVAVVYEDNESVFGATFPEKGIYFRNSSLLIDYGDPSYVCFFSAVVKEGEIKQLDEKFIPDSIATKEDINNFIDLTVKNSLTVGDRLEYSNIGQYSTTLGLDCEASGEQSSASGYYTRATAQGAHAEGFGTIASGSFSHAEGDAGDPGETVASGYGSHAEGGSTKASGIYSHTEGFLTKASGEAAHAEGYGTKASGQYQHVIGKSNIEDKEDKYAHIVGNGSLSEPSNAHTLDWNGNAWFQGNVSVDGTPTDDNHLVTKKYVDEAIANASLGNGSDVSDSGVIEDSEFDDLISGTFGPEYVNKDE